MPAHAMQRMRDCYAAGICVAGVAAVSAPIVYYVYKNYRTSQEKKQPDSTDFPLSCVRGYTIPQQVQRICIKEDAVTKTGHKITTATVATRCELLCKIRANRLDDVRNVTISSRHGAHCYEFCTELLNNVDARVDYELLVPEGRTVVFQ
jgi:hypothetical protein